MRDATKEEELKVIKAMLKSRLSAQGKVATDTQIEQMANKIIGESDEKIKVLEGRKTKE